MPTMTIPIGSLWSTKNRIDFRSDPSGIPGESFFQLVRAFRSGVQVPPIEVVNVGSGRYVILNGVRRAMAAKCAGRHSIEAVVSSTTVAGAMIGNITLLDNVLFPYDMRG